MVLGWILALLLGCGSPAEVDPCPAECLGETSDTASPDTASFDTASPDTADADADVDADTDTDTDVDTDTDTDTTVDTGTCPEDLEPPGSGRCPEACTDGCSGGVCYIECDWGGACSEQSITCPDGWPCEIFCGRGSAACRGTLITGGLRGSVAVECAGGSSCLDAVVTC